MRYKRAVTVLFMSRVSDNKRADQMEGLREYVPDAEYPQSMLYYAWDSYPVRDAEQALAAA
jgi:salicylate hydroxylase